MRSDSSADLNELSADLCRFGEHAEPQRIGAAYQLAEHAQRKQCLEILARALRSERESVRRAATFGLIAMGEDAATHFLQACRSPRKWLREIRLPRLLWLLDMRRWLCRRFR